MHLQDIKGHWALVTGASSGIGREFCQQLAAAGLHLVMVARREQVLTALAKQLTEVHQVRALPLPVDLSSPNSAGLVKERLEQERVTIRLLCNVAAAGRWGRFETTSPETYEDMIRLNTAAVVALCRHFISDLTSFPTSVVINVSSQAAYQPVPFMAVYAATKAFVHSFSQALYGEWKDLGILVQTLVPGPTQSEFDEKAGAYQSAVGQRGSPTEVVKVALAHLGKDTPVVSHARGTFKQRLFAALAPPKMVIKTVRKMFQPPEGDGN